MDICTVIKQTVVYTCSALCVNRNGTPLPFTDKHFAKFWELFIGYSQNENTILMGHSNNSWDCWGGGED